MERCDYKTNSTLDYELHHNPDPMINVDQITKTIRDLFSENAKPRA